MLIQQLRDFTAEGIVARHDFREVPPKVEYTITDFGRTLALGKITSSP
ncbi:winged helix-turn-helix transcriptional regulator [Advenella incenata]